MKFRFAARDSIERCWRPDGDDALPPQPGVAQHPSMQPRMPHTARISRRDLLLMLGPAAWSVVKSGKATPVNGFDRRSGARSRDEPLPHRWVFVQRRFDSDEDVEDIRKFASIASKNGLNGMVLNVGIDTIDLKPPAFVARLQKAKEILRQYHLELIPVIFSVGYGSAILAHDPNLAEGLPVKGALYVVKNREARLIPEIPVTDGGPEIEGVWTREIKVRPYRCYRISFHAKTEGVRGYDGHHSGSFGLTVETTDKRNLAPVVLHVSSTGSFDIRWGFNSLWYDRVRLTIGTSREKTGKAWVGGVRVEEVGLLNVLRRPGTPITVRADEGNTVYEEGRDFSRIADSQMIDPHAQVVTFRFDHDGPPIQILPGSRIREDQRLRVSYYHGFSFENGQTTICMAEPKVYEIWRRVARQVTRALAPSRYLLSMDEIREGGTCKACQGRNMAQLLGECFTRQFHILREMNPNVDVWTWSDMLDPNHNAHGNYYLVKGSFTGSWNYVPKKLGIMCWYYQKLGLSLDFFSKHGFRTMGSVDMGPLQYARNWLMGLAKTPNAQGIMYTTWYNKYVLLAAFGKLVSQYR